MRYRERKSAEAGIDISPLIDMVFILLIFFMVSTTFVKDLQIDIERPNAQSAVKSSSKAVRVHVTRSGDIFLDGRSVRSWMLQSRVKDLIAVSTEKSVLVVTDRAVPAEKLIEVVDQCRMAGAKDVGVATDQEAG